MSQADDPEALAGGGPTVWSRLVARAVAGESGAVETLVAEVRQRVHRYCRARLRGFPGADQAVSRLTLRQIIAPGCW